MYLTERYLEVGPRYFFNLFVVNHVRLFVTVCVTGIFDESRAAAESFRRQRSARPYRGSNPADEMRMRGAAVSGWALFVRSAVTSGLEPGHPWLRRSALTPFGCPNPAQPNSQWMALPAPGAPLRKPRCLFFEFTRPTSPDAA